MACILAMAPSVSTAATRTAAAATVHQHSLTTGVALARKAADLLALNAFGSQAQPLQSAVNAVMPTTTDHAALLQKLKTDDTAAAADAGLLTADGVVLAPGTVRALTPLSSADQAAAAAGHQVNGGFQPYLGGIDDLLLRDGQQPAKPTPPDPTAVANALTAALAAVGPPPTATPQATAPPPTVTAGPTPNAAASTGASSPINDVRLWILLVALVAIVIGALTLGASHRRRRPAGPATGSSTPDIRDLLEVSRRLTSMTSVAAVHRGAVREAMTLVPSRAAGLVLRRQDQLAVGHESQADLFVSDQLAEGLISRVAETGQPITQVSATERSLRNLPAAIAAVPLVGRGSVEAVLVMVREPARPYTAEERDLLLALAPVIAAAMQTAERASAAVEASLVDQLTNVGNRRRFDADLATLLSRTGAHATALIMIDVDHFKEVNDTHGHASGDAVLRAVADAIVSTVRPGDQVYRFGGEEFCVTLDNPGDGDAADAAERIRVAIAAREFDLGNGSRIRRTASFGVATVTGGGADDLIRQADAALYHAKESGRDRVCVSGS